MKLEAIVADGEGRTPDRRRRSEPRSAVVISTKQRAAVRPEHKSEYPLDSRQASRRALELRLSRAKPVGLGTCQPTLVSILDHIECQHSMILNGIVSTYRRRERMGKSRQRSGGDELMVPSELAHNSAGAIFIFPKFLFRLTVLVSRSLRSEHQRSFD